MDCKSRTPIRPTQSVVAWLAFVACLAPMVPLAAQTEVPYRDRAPEFQELIHRIALELDRAWGPDHATYRARYRQLEEAIHAWNDSSRTDADAEVMGGWLRGALRLALAQSDRAFPPPPQFTRNASRPDRPAAPPSLSPKIELPLAPADQVAADTATATAAAPSVSAAGSEPAHVPPAAWDRRDGLSPIYRGATRIDEPRPREHVVRRHDPGSTPAISPQPMEPEPGRVSPMQERDVFAKTVEDPTQPISRSEKDAAPPAADEPVERPAVAGSAPANAVANAATDKEQAVLDVSDPFRDDPLPPGDTVDLAPAASVGRPASVRGVARTGRIAEPGVNLAELRARIEGYDRGLRTVESRLMGYEALSPADLTRLAAALDDLLSQREFVALYVGTLTDAERRGLPQLREASPAVDLLAQQIVEKRHALQRRAVLDNDDRRRDWLLLQEASRRLTNLGTEAPAE